MKISAIVLVFTYFLSSYRAEAITYSVVGPCSPLAIHQGNFKTDLAESVGLTSVNLFTEENIPFVGSDTGMASILGTPTGVDAIEILSDTKIRAYGWCFSVNGVIPDVLSSETYFKSQSDHLLWFFAYSTYDQGVWTDYCVPSHRIKSQQFCKNP